MAKKVLARFSDAQLFLFIRHLFAAEGFQVVLAGDNDACAQADEADYAAVVIDVSGAPCPMALLQVRQSFPQAALVVLSRRDQQWSDRLGCNDLLLSRPFNPSKLVRFLRQLRYRDSTAGLSLTSATTLKYADIEMNLARMQVLRGGLEVPLTPLQFRLLRHMLERPGDACTREEFIECCWPENIEVEPRTVDIHLGHIRRTLTRFGPDLIRTVRGSGYALRKRHDIADVTSPGDSGPHPRT
ncbi:winged helix-turn-helix transcriptional regulator [Pararhizobium arenae]|uniref:winged helix-turn-helix transcriptional regulator n=1 Tax=Pararhizobium arenae TaxID=1856850 RepID=UPI00094AC485|nr:response regulator transcription factor [Pararhizobium arenae]